MTIQQVALPFIDIFLPLGEENCGRMACAYIFDATIEKINSHYNRNNRHLRPTRPLKL